LIFDGKLVQYSPSKDFYEHPATERIARFFGNDNIVHGIKSGTIVSTPFGSCSVRPDLKVPDGEVSLLIRPESICLGKADVNHFKFRIKKKIYMGTYTRYTIEANGIEWDVTGDSHDISGYEEGNDASFNFPPEKVWLIQRHEELMEQKARSCTDEK
jgi:putative spermidine/putrescine transport system ATP-binding protein